MLDLILAPLRRQEFFAEVWEQRAALCRGDRRRYADLFARDRLFAILGGAALPHPDCLLVLDGEPVEVATSTEAVAAISRGATLSFDRIDDHDAAVAKLAAGLEAELEERIKVRAYLSQAGHRGLRAHYDTHDTIILQLEGTKLWRVYQPTVPAPLRRSRPRAERCPEAPYLEVTLEPGDTLYIPRGHWHAPIALAGESLHLTVGVHPKTGVDFVEWLASEWAHDERFRRAIADPKRRAPENDLGTAPGFRDRLARVLEVIRERLADRDLADRFAAFCRSSLRDRLPEARATGGAPLRSDATYTVRMEARPHLRADGATIVLAVPGQILRFAASTHPLIELVFRERTFRGSILAERCPQVPAHDARMVLTTLVASGVIAPTEDERGGDVP